MKVHDRRGASQMRALLVATVTILAAPLANAAEPAAVSALTIKFEIAPQPMAEALKALAEQANLQIMFRPQSVSALRTAGVSGKMSAEEALRSLLVGTVLEYVKTGNVVVVRGKGEAPVRTEKLTGTTLSVADMPDLQLAWVAATDAVSEKSGAVEAKPASKGGDVEEMVVEERRIKPYVDANVDIPRTINDPQPYYIFDSETIRKSGAYNIEDFLKQRLTMNTVVQTNSQRSPRFSNSGGSPVTQMPSNMSTVNLRGLGADKTLVLINGRRMAGTTLNDTNDVQTDLNGIPLNAIERIEVLPSSASGIYGGSALGGVINVILKRDYAGGELRAAYDNTWDSDSPTRAVSASYGLSLEGGKTHLNVHASWSDAEPLLVQDRVDIFKKNLAEVQARRPTFIVNANNAPWLGSVPNIVNAPVYVPVAAGTPGSFGPYAPGTDFGGGPTTAQLPNVLAQSQPLILDDGRSLGTRITHISPGISPTTSAADLVADLWANRGSWNLDFPKTSQAPTGLLLPFAHTPTVKSLQLNLRRKMSRSVEVFADMYLNENRSESIHNPIPNYIEIRNDVAINPFVNAVYISMPNAAQTPYSTRSRTKAITLGTLAKLPGNWTGGLDFTWSESEFGYLGVTNNAYTSQGGLLTPDLNSGLFNPFVDLLSYPSDYFYKHNQPFIYDGSNDAYDVSLRGSGPVVPLPWGAANLTIGLQHHRDHTPERTFDNVSPLTDVYNTATTYFERNSARESAYMEMSAPLIKTAWLPLLHSLELQWAGRAERYELDTGASSRRIVYTTPPGISYGGLTLNGQPYFSRDSYTAKNYTLGFKYQPVQDVTLRMSRATAFLPPQSSQLVKNPLQSTNTTPVNDPRNGQNGVPVYTVGGGNPDLKPQNSKSTNVGLIWDVAADLRLNLEYYRIQQFDAIGTLSAQQIVDLESIYPQRVTRNSAGRIGLVDISSVNLYRRDTAGWDISANYAIKTPWGHFGLNAVESIIVKLQEQYSLTSPSYELVTFVNEGGATKYKTSTTLNWDWKKWTAGWSVRYIGSYKQSGATGGPTSVRSFNGGPTNSTTLLAQGGDTIPSQTYHDLFVGYAFGLHGAGSSSRLDVARLVDGVSVQFGMRNVFNKAGPLDVYYANNYYLSPYGDTRMRSYWLSVTKNF